jgi:hypothetical protein
VPTSLSCPRSGKRPAAGRALALDRHRVAADAGAKEGVGYSTDKTKASDNPHAWAVSGPGRREVGAVSGATARVSLG